MLRIANFSPDQVELPTSAKTKQAKAAHAARPRVEGKFLYLGEEKFWLRGVTYGTFRPDENGGQFPSPGQVEQDFKAMADNRINTVRVYTVPPRWLLDTASRRGLRVMVGLPWEQHITFLDGAGRAEAIEKKVREAVRSCTGHPAILCYAIGNEIPAPIVRWHGRRRIERFLKRLYRAAKAEDPEALVTYVNYPTTEYLELPFLDLLCFNVYLESEDSLQAYLARLQHLAGERPLLLAEIGLDSRRNGRDAQAESLRWQVRTAFAAGCAGAIVFAWTDEWYRGGHDIEDWDFGLVTREREPKPALAAINRAFVKVPFPTDIGWPRISVVVCSFNGARTIRDTLRGLQRLDYPNYEVIVINDGSTDDTADIAKKYHVRLISTENRGLSNARNSGWQAAGGEIVAYIDDDAYPDPHWLQYLAHTFMTTDYVGVGGPNIAPPGDGPIADCVANAPGGPIHVLISDTEAEHIPGCNMAFRREVLAAIGGFDPRYRAAGDDVDLCWRLQEQGWKIGFHPAAVNWHHRRNSIKAYWKQQQGYGKAEALLEKKWPQRYNGLGHLAWTGRMYGNGLTETLNRRWRVYHGTWGSAPFQSLYQPAPGVMLSLPLMPEWYLLIALLAGLSAAGLLWAPLLFALPVLGLAIAAPVAQACLSAAKASFSAGPVAGLEKLKLQGLTAFLHLMQPLARLIGRLRHGLAPWRRRSGTSPAGIWKRKQALWRETWRPPEHWLRNVEHRLRERKLSVTSGGNYDTWDLQIQGGLLGRIQTCMVIEEHGAGRQMLRFRTQFRCSLPGTVSLVLFAILTVSALFDQAWIVAAFLGGIGLLLAWRIVQEIAFSQAALAEVLDQLESDCT